ncbi:MAG: CinA family protein [Blautia sp.]|nr:CinA family protein [Blautia sp.]
MTDDQERGTRSESPAARHEGAPEEIVVKLLKDRGFWLTMAESCTGGLVASRIVNVSGASAVFKGGFVTYTEEAKMKCLGVTAETLRTDGVVSAKCAREMAEGAAKALEADVSVSVTGLAGPDGGTEKTPVGTVFMACYVRGRTTAKEYHFAGGRAEIRQAAAREALELVHAEIMKI